MGLAEIDTFLSGKTDDAPKTPAPFPRLPDPATLKGRRVQSDNGEYFRSDGYAWYRDLPAGPGQPAPSLPPRAEKTGQAETKRRTAAELLGLPPRQESKQGFFGRLGEEFIGRTGLGPAPKALTQESTGGEIGAAALGPILGILGSPIAAYSAFKEATRDLTPGEREEGGRPQPNLIEAGTQVAAPFVLGEARLPMGRARASEPVSPPATTPPATAPTPPAPPTPAAPAPGWPPSAPKPRSVGSTAAQRLGLEAPPKAEPPSAPPGVKTISADKVGETFGIEFAKPPEFGPPMPMDLRQGAHQPKPKPPPPPTFERTKEGMQGVIEGTPDPELKLGSQESTVFKDAVKVAKEAEMAKRQESLPVPAKPAPPSSSRGIDRQREVAQEWLTDKLGSQAAFELSKIDSRSGIWSPGLRRKLERLGIHPFDAWDLTHAEVPSASVMERIMAKAAPAPALPSHSVPPAPPAPGKRANAFKGAKDPWGETGAPNLNDPDHLYAIVQRFGRIKPGPDLAGEVRGIPPWAKGKNGASIDSIAEALLDEYPHLGDRKAVKEQILDGLTRYSVLRQEKARKALRAKEAEAAPLAPPEDANFKDLMDFFGNAGKMGLVATAASPEELAKVERQVREHLYRRYRQQGYDPSSAMRRIRAMAAQYAEETRR